MESTNGGRIRSEVNPPVTKLEDDTLVELLLQFRRPRSADEIRRSPRRNSDDSPPTTRKRRRRTRSKVVGPSPISKLGDDLVVQILIRLPNPRYTCRCKSICKRWRSLISDPSFNRRLLSHHQSRTEPPPLLLPSYDTQFVIRSFLPMPDEEVGRRLTVWDTNRDLVLCGFSDSDRNNSQLPRSYLVCNPFTKQWIALPLAPQKNKGYIAPVARLVCEPRISYNLELGDGQVHVHCSEYRFRVVCVYGYTTFPAIMVDVFCSESGEWIKEAFVDRDAFGLFHTNLLSWDSELWCCYYKLGCRPNNFVLASFNPFRLDLPPTMHLDASAIFGKSCNLNLTQGTLHTIRIQPPPACSTVWRLEYDRKSWRKQCEVLFKASNGDYDPNETYVPQLHPEKLETVFVLKSSGIYFWDSSKGDVEFVSDFKRHLPYWRVHQLRVSCWPTQITRYKELRGVYDGSHSCWVQQTSNGPITPSIIGCQLVDRVEKQSEEINQHHTPRPCVKKQKVTQGGDA